MIVVTAATLWVAGGCSDDPSEKESSEPLALYAGEWNQDLSALSGEFVQDGPCLYVESSTIGSPGRWLVAFGAAGTSWSETERAVSVPGAEYRVGANVRLGGSGLAAGWSIEWVAPPAESCDQARIWLAGLP